ncbi:hypothetical protein [Streptomyces rhizosphaerihabitans]|nr:hypothetical protein [Streptomyces rhizosphaerihabitans]MCT9011668.1 hypothetical protein [Streptomyces rhizosphaerihabitans]
MDELRFDAPIGTMAIGHRDNSLMLLRSTAMGRLPSAWPTW